MLDLLLVGFTHVGIVFGFFLESGFVFVEFFNNLFLSNIDETTKTYQIKIELRMLANRNGLFQNKTPANNAQQNDTEKRLNKETVSMTFERLKE